MRLKLLIDHGDKIPDSGSCKNPGKVKFKYASAGLDPGQKTFFHVKLRLGWTKVKRKGGFNCSVTR